MRSSIASMMRPETIPARTAAGLLLAAAPVGCWVGGSELRPGLAANDVPSPTLLSRPIDCRRAASGETTDKEVIATTAWGEALLGGLDESLQRLGPALEPLPPRLCGDLLQRDALDDGDWNAPVPPSETPQLLERYRADTLLVALVSDDWRCVSEGEHAIRCNETRLDMVAYLFSADLVVWKGRWQLGIGNETPDLSGGLVEMFEALPVSHVATLQDPEAPTYERALKEAGVTP